MIFHVFFEVKQLAKIKAFLFFVFALQFTLSAQVISTRGREFYVSFYQNYGNPNSSDIILFLTSSVNTSGTITNPNTGFNQPFIITAGNVTQVILPHPEAENATPGIVTNRGLIITAVDTISAYALSSRPASSDATTVLQKNALGVDYLVAGYHTSSPLPSCFLIEATLDNTIVKIIPSVKTLDGHLPGIPFNITLNKGQTYYQTSVDYDLSGSSISVINGCKPIAVFSGAEGATVPFGGGDGDVIYEQLFPTNSFGKQFITAPLKDRNVHRVRIYAASNNTSIDINGNVVSNINAGSFYEFESNNQPKYITLTKPAQVIEFAPSEDYDNLHGPYHDGAPTMITLAPLEQQLKESIFLSPTTGIITAHKLTVICKTADIASTLLDGVNIGASFTAVPANPVYSYAAISVSAGQHKMTGRGFIAYCYGFGDTQGYGYCTGASVEDINTYFTCNQTSSIGNPTIDVCSGASVFDIVTSQSGNSSYTWDFGDGSLPVTTNGAVLQQTHTYSTPGTYTVTLTTTNGSVNVCSQNNATIAQITLQVQSSLTPSLSLLSSPASPVCIGSTVSFIATPTNGGANPSYQWKLNGSNVGNNAPTFTTSSLADNDIVSCILTSGISCATTPTAAASLTMHLSAQYAPNITIATAATSICLGSSATFFATSQGTQVSPQYQWQINGINIGSNNTTIAYTPANGDVVSCVISTNNNCGLNNTATSNSITMSLVSNVNATVNITASKNPVCADSNVTFTALPVNGGSSPAYQWKLNGLNTGINSSVYSSSSLKTNDAISCVMTSNSACASNQTAASNSITIQLYSITLGLDTTLCEGNTKLLDASNINSTYKWQDNSTSPTYLVTKPGKYFVAVNKQGCILKDTVDVTYTYKPQFSLGADTSICIGGIITLDSKLSALNYLWQDGSTTQTYKVTQPGLYSLTVTNNCGPATDDIVINSGVCNLYIPNSFTPNGDAKNDLFKIGYGDNITEFHMQVYNRYGQLIFESRDKQQGWNGTYKGSRQPNGAYAWMIRYKTSTNDGLQKLQGTVLIVR